MYIWYIIQYINVQQQIYCKEMHRPKIGPFLRAPQLCGPQPPPEPVIETTGDVFTGFFSVRSWDVHLFSICSDALNISSHFWNSCNKRLESRLRYWFLQYKLNDCAFSLKKLRWSAFLPRFLGPAPSAPWVPKSGPGPTCPAALPPASSPPSSWKLLLKKLAANK